ncbi:enolase C-terminal domain-like protein [Brachybacterium timonense]|uniref:enolase C-terminal domain-like protein n=1 Tax=Brachybacterium timonense TaxID=2050896 RepID=UPI000D0B8CDE|nr:enolase C-terminal domain-like protein [Brachybacterium timonense]
MSTVIALDVKDVRFPTSRMLDGSDAMNPDPDYSAAYVVVRTSGEEEGHGLVFTIGRGNDVQCAAIRALEPKLLGRDVDVLLASLGEVSRELIEDSQLRWLGPEKGVMHMAIGAVLNALWDMRARREKKPLWLLLAELDVEEILDLVDFRYLSDALTRDEAAQILHRAQPGREAAIARLREHGYPAYTTSAGWLGYSDDKVTSRLKEAVEQGFSMVKLKVGRDIADDRRRFAVAREQLGPDFPIAVDANQTWDVAEAVAWIEALAEFNPYWVEEPTSPDDVLGHAAIRTAVSPVRIATGEQVQNRIIFKQMLQAGSLDVLQLDATRVGGVGENIAILLLAAKFGVPVCPHAGGVGLCELVQHLIMFDSIAVSGEIGSRRLEYVDHLHEHFETPVVISRGAYQAPEAPGSGARILEESLAAHTFPEGEVWRAEVSV